MHTSIDGLNFQDIEKSVAPYNMISYFSEHSNAVDTTWLNSFPSLCDLTTHRYIDIAYSSRDARSVGATYATSGPARVLEVPRYIQDVCGVKATEKELDTAQKIISDDKRGWSNAQVTTHTNHINFLRQRIKICQTLLPLGVQVSTEKVIMGWKSPAAKEICKTASPDNVYMWPEESTFGFSGSYIPRDLHRGVVFLLLIWAGISLVMLVQSDPLEFNDEGTKKHTRRFSGLFQVLHVLVMVGFTIAYGLTTLYRSWSRGQNFVEHSEKPMRMFEETQSGYQWKDQVGEQTIKNMKSTPTGSTTMIYFIIVVSCLAYDRYARRQTNISKRKNQMYERTSTVDADAVVGYGAQKELPSSNAAPVIVVDDGNSEQGFAKQWKVSSFGIKPQKFAPNVDFNPHATDVKMTTLTRKDINFEVSWDNAELYSYMDWEIDTIFRILLLPAFFLSEFSMRTVYSYDTEYQILFLGALALSLLDFFMAVFQKIGFMLMRIEANMSKSYVIDSFILFVLECISFVIKLFIVLAITHVAENRNENYVNMDYESVKLSITQESSHFNAKVWAIFSIAQIFTILRWFNVWSTWRGWKGWRSDPNFIRSNVRSNACGIAIFFTIFVIVATSYSRHFNQLPISKTLQEDWYGHRVVSFSGVYTRIS